MIDERFCSIHIEPDITHFGITSRRTIYKLKEFYRPDSWSCAIPYGHEIIGIEGYISETGIITHFAFILWAIPEYAVTKEER